VWIASLKKKSYYINQDTRNTIALLTPLLLFGGSFDIHIVATPGTGVKYYIYTSALSELNPPFVIVNRSTVSRRDAIAEP
jgi:hypothetical protein